MRRRTDQQIILDREKKLPIRPTQRPDFPVRVFHRLYPDLVILHQRQQQRFKKPNHVQLSQITNIQEIIFTQTDLMTGDRYRAISQHLFQFRIGIRQRVDILQIRVILFKIRISLQRLPDKILPQPFMNTVYRSYIHFENSIHGYRLQGIELSRLLKNPEPHDQPHPKQQTGYHNYFSLRTLPHIFHFATLINATILRNSNEIYTLHLLL